MSEKRLRAEIDRLTDIIRAIELRVDGLNTRAYPQQKNTQAALDYIKDRAREALRDYR